MKEFIEKSRKIHDNKYDYSKVDYKNNSTKVCIICPEHGEFWQTPANHTHKSHPRGCPKCNKGVALTTEEFIEHAKEIHGNKYDYSKVEYTNNHTKICIVCPEHGEFWQLPSNHTHKSHPRGCPKCNKGVSLTLDEFIDKARVAHNNKYDYSKVDYKNYGTKVCIICPEHGEFWQTPSSHLSTSGCPKCKNNFPLTTEIFIKKATNMHNNKYDYAKVQYVNTSTKVCIICPEHGEFWQTPNSHLQGHACPYCKTSLLEQHIERILSSNNIKYEQEKRFEWLAKTSDKRSQMPLDFYLPDYNIAIECQGAQHFKYVPAFGTKYNYPYVKENDKLKKTLCAQHGIKILYFSNLKISYPYEVFEDVNKLLKEILGD